MTAVEWLVKELENLTALQFYQEIIVEQAKEMEKQQIIDAYLRGIKNYDPTFKIDKK